MSVTLRESAEAAQRLVGAQFEKNGRKFVVRRVLIEFDDVHTEARYVSRYADGIAEFSDWISEVPDDCA